MASVDDPQPLQRGAFHRCGCAIAGGEPGIIDARNRRRTDFFVKLAEPQLGGLISRMGDEPPFQRGNRAFRIAAHLESSCGGKNIFGDGRNRKQWENEKAS